MTSHSQEDFGKSMKEIIIKIIDTLKFRHVWITIVIIFLISIGWVTIDEVRVIGQNMVNKIDEIRVGLDF